uniref:Uncharacterized protein n=1 Tax=Kalanchoe fedtschenkoi TaxID=63787 RepID=A0A7N0V3U8_KALFE
MNLLPPSAPKPDPAGAQPTRSTRPSRAQPTWPTSYPPARFQALTSSFTNNGTCHVSNQYLTTALLAVCSLICFLSSFTDSFVHDGKLYHGMATCKGLYVFNGFDELGGGGKKDLSKCKLGLVDFVHAFTSLIVFLVFAFSSSNVQGCFFGGGGEDLRTLTANLPLGVGVLASFLFTVFPTSRRGIGYSDMVPQPT